jgi:hypothetical protein
MDFSILHLTQVIDEIGFFSMFFVFNLDAPSLTEVTTHLMLILRLVVGNETVKLIADKNGRSSPKLN